MEFAVLPPWGPWSDNVVPLVRLSGCLIRTANGAPPPSTRPSPPRLRLSVPTSGLRRSTLRPEEDTGLGSIAASSLELENVGQSLLGMGLPPPCLAPGPSQLQGPLQGGWGLGQWLRPHGEHRRGAPSTTQTAITLRVSSAHRGRLRSFALCEIFGDGLPGPGAVSPLQQVTDEMCSSDECRWRSGYPLPPLSTPMHFPLCFLSSLYLHPVSSTHPGPSVCSTSGLLDP